jgi:uncharacterized membrane protein YeaQ/YmgE (transglycosylase-associated protein family)
MRLRLTPAARLLLALLFKESAMGILGWILFGLIVGIIARFLMPGPQPMGIIITILLGIAGSFVGGYLGSLVRGRPLDGAEPAGWIGAILCSMLLLFLYGRYAKKAA